MTQHSTSAAAAQSPAKDEASISQARELVDRAYAAFLQYQNFTQEQVDRVVDAVASAAESAAERLARLAVEETGYGIIEHKIEKNRFAARRVHEAIRPLKTVGVVRQDEAQGILEIAVPVGVVAAILPSTNPTSTAVYKVLIALKGRNAVVLSPHPTALKCSCEAAALMRDAATQAGAPADVICCLTNPTLAGTQELMKHRRTSVILATGGLGMVRAAYSSGKPAFGVGPGNVPAFIDRSADVPKAVADVVRGKTFDNGTICSSEQAIVAEETLRETITSELMKQGAYLLNPGEAARLGKQMVNVETHTICPKFVGRAAPVVADLAGLKVPASTRVLVAVLDSVGRAQPLSAEKLSPVLALYFERDRIAAMDRCVELLRFGGLGHTCAIHAKDESVVREYGLRMPAYRVVVNSPAPLGSIGETTNLFPALTLGCGAAGGNITSDNISPLHLINLKRVAWERAETRTNQAATLGCGCSNPTTTSPTSDSSDPGVRWAVTRAVDRFLAARQQASPDRPPKTEPTAPAAAPEMRVAALKSRPVPFVSEAEVRAAVRNKNKILVGSKTIITPAARDLGQEYDVFVFND